MRCRAPLIIFPLSVPVRRRPTGKSARRDITIARWPLHTTLVGKNASDLSFVDQVSFLTMQLRGMTTAFAFDDDFEEAGFDLY